MHTYLLSALLRKPVTEPAPTIAQGELDAVLNALGDKSRRRLGRSLAIREVDAGSCNGCEMEINAVSNPYYDLGRFGIKFVASPRHADVLLVSGPVTRTMRGPLQVAYDAMPNPKWVVALGDCAKDGGCFKQSYAVVGGVSDVLPVDLHIPGCAPRPIEILKGLVSVLELAR